MSENTLIDSDTGADTNTQAESTKTYTQDEVNAMIARAKGSIAKKYESKYADLGDPEEIRSLKSEAEKRRTDEQLKRGEFEKTLQEIVSKKDTEIAKRDAMIQDFKLNTPLIETASRLNAVKPTQVRDLLRSYVQLDEEGNTVVVDNTGKVKYTDKGKPLSVEDLVQNFLNENPHFVSATPTTTNSKSNITTNGPSKVDPSKLNMNNPEHRELYKQYRKEHGIA